MVNFYSYIDYKGLFTLQISKPRGELTYFKISLRLTTSQTVVQKGNIICVYKYVLKLFMGNIFLNPYRQNTTIVHTVCCTEYCVYNPKMSFCDSLYLHFNPQLQEEQRYRINISLDIYTVYMYGCNTVYCSQFRVNAARSAGSWRLECLPLVTDRLTPQKPSIGVPGLMRVEMNNPSAV